MFRRSSRIALEALLALVLLVVLVSAAALWRLSAGPVPVDFLNERLEQAFSSAEGPVRVEVGSTELIWGGWQRTVDLRARHWRLVGPDGRTIAQLPEAAVTLSLRALLQGVVAPTRIEILGARLTFQRDEEGRFGIAEAASDSDGEGATGEADTPGEVAALVPGLVARLLSPADPKEPLSFLRSVEASGLTVTLIDRRSRVRLQARNASLELAREAGALVGSATLALDLGGEPVMVETALDYVPPRGDDPGALRIDASVRDLFLPELARLSPDLEPLGRAVLPLDGLVEAVLTPDGILQSLAFDLVTGPGSFNLPEAYDAPLEIAGFAIAGTFDGPQRHLAVEDLELQLGGLEAPGPSLRARVNLDLQEDYADLGIGARVDRVEVPELQRYWPQGASRGGRAWVLENITAGLAENLELVASVRIPLEAPDAAEISRFNGSFEIAGVEAHYLRPMPPVTGISGRASFDPDGLTFELDQGQTGDISVGPATVRLYGLSTKEHLASIAFEARGGLKPTLRLLDHPRLKLIERLGIGTEGTSGQIAADVAFDFPLIGSLSEDDLRVRADARLTEVAMPDAAFGQDVTGGTLALALDMTKMRIEGPLRLADTPAEVAWTEYFVPKGKIRRELTAQTAALDEAARVTLGLPLERRLFGPVSASASLVGLVDDTSSVAVKVGLAEAAIEIPDLKWRKPPGAAGTVEFTAELWGERLVAVRDLELAAGTLAVTGSASFSPEDGRFLQANVGRFALQATSLEDIQVRRWLHESGTEGWEVRIAGGRIDAARWMSDDASSEPQPTSAAGEDDDPPETPLDLEVVRLQSLSLEDGRGLEAVTFRGRRGPQGWESLTASGEVPRAWWRMRGAPKPQDSGIEAKRVSLEWGPVGEGGGYALDVRADDLGATLRALDWVDDMEGGRTQLTGRSTGPWHSAPVEAQLEVREFTLIDAPLIGRILAGASLGGLGGMLAEDNGITFERGTGELIYENGIVASELVRAYGPALGITARGTLDPQTDTIDLQGTVVPAYAINQVLGAIPILGPLLTGGEGEGVLGVTYGVSGPLEDPDVSVNPLSALAPGFLRGIFSGKIDGDHDALDALPNPGGTR